MTKKLITTTLCLMTIGILLSQQIKAGKIKQKNNKTTIHVTNVILFSLNPCILFASRLF